MTFDIHLRSTHIAYVVLDVTFNHFDVQTKDFYGENIFHNFGLILWFEKSALGKRFWHQSTQLTLYVQFGDLITFWQTLKEIEKLLCEKELWRRLSTSIFESHFSALRTNKVEIFPVM